MNYIDEIFTRADIQQVREFLLHGTEGIIDPRPYKERLENAHKKFYERIQKNFPNQTELDEIIVLFYDYINQTEEVYMEIGLQVGAMLAAQIAQNFKTALKGNEQEGSDKA